MNEGRVDVQAARYGGFPAAFQLMPATALHTTFPSFAKGGGGPTAAAAADTRNTNTVDVFLFHCSQPWKYNNGQMLLQPF